MWNKLNYQTKTYVLIGAILMALVIGYFTSFKNSINSYREYVRFQDQSINYHSVSDLAILKRKHDKLDSAFQQIRNSDYDRILILEINKLIDQHDLDLVSLDHQKVKSKIIDQVVLEGRYQDMVKTVFELETDFYAGRVRSTRYEIIKNKKTKRKELNVKLYLQRNDAHINP